MPPARPASRRRVIAALAAGAVASGVSPRALSADNLRVVEIRVYKLKPGVRDRFLALFGGGVLEMLQRHRIVVLGHGPSKHDADSCFLMRAYPSAEARNEQLKSFYGSDEWKRKYDAAATEMIETYNTLVLDAGDPALAALAKVVASA